MRVRPDKRGLREVISQIGTLGIYLKHIKITLESRGAADLAWIFKEAEGRHSPAFQ